MIFNLCTFGRVFGKTWDGAASSFVEFVLDGDTSAVPPTMNHAIYLIIEGAVEADSGSNKSCEDK